MSRLEFRATVEAARPASAWLMVTVASATVWITQQLAPWVIAVQVVTLAVTLARRVSPFGWQRSAIALNAGMFGITATTISVALQGNPAAISLAYFAALTQALQLVDARPRKSEFLLVALALFQVVLAANLTDSVLYPPLLAVFLVATTWTLLVHTLRTEAIEAGDARGVPRAITPTLARTALGASTASIALALVIFILLPRIGPGLLKSGLARGNAVSGFSDRVELGEIGRIRQDPSTVMRIETLRGRAPDPADAYWRGLAFDHFDGRRWSITPPLRRGTAGSPRLGIDLGPATAEPRLVQRIVREPVEAGALFSAGQPSFLEGPLHHVERDVNGGLYAPSSVEERVRYTVHSVDRRATDSGLGDDRAAPPRGKSGRFLGLPRLDPAVGEFARAITRVARRDADRVRAIERYLGSQGRYTDTPPQLGDDAQSSPIESFLLGDLAGHCEYFASGMVVLARSLGIPARLVNGFAGGRENTIGGFVEVTRADAHSWVEIHYENAGWVRYDPTPADLRLRHLTGASWGERLAELGSAVELWWFQRVVDFDSSDQIAALRSAWGVWRSLEGGDAAQTQRRGWGGLRDVPWRDVGLALLGALLVVVLLRRRSVTPQDARIPKLYAQAIRLLGRRGLKRDPTTTARAFAEGARSQLSTEAGAAFASLTEHYLAQRFGDRGPGASHELFETFKRSLKVSSPLRAPTGSGASGG